ncbi:MAG: tape measure protein, partial [Acutalibacteraceae bacterium]|nr:tape measure protein [Acutalibacteraceae bacterium]
MATEKVGILIELEDPDRALDTLRQIDSTIRDIGRKRTMIKLDDGNIVSIDERIKEIQDKLAAVRSSKGGKILDHGEVKTAKDLNNELRILKQGLRDGTKEAKTFAQTFNSISSKVAHIGSAMQSFGNALTTLTSPFSRLTEGILMGVGFKAVNSFTEGFERGFERYDTMKKFPKIMASFGFGETEAKAAIDALDQSVRGLPTGLDEMVDLTQRFTATVGDLDKGTKLAIATNNAFLASMSTDTQRYQGMMQLQDVLGGKDMNAREWNSLVSSMTPAIVKMGEAMKESGEWSGSIGDFIQYVRDGKMDNQKFIDQLIEIGNKGGALEAMAQESKDTWQAFFANVGNASSRMTAGIIQAFDEISRSATGKDVNQLFADTI